MNGIVRLEEKVEKMIALINELKQRILELEEENQRLKEKELGVKKKIDDLIDRIDSMMI